MLYVIHLKNLDTAWGKFKVPLPIIRVEGKNLVLWYSPSFELTERPSVTFSSIWSPTCTYNSSCVRKQSHLAHLDTNIQLPAQGMICHTFTLYLCSVLAARGYELTSRVAPSLKNFCTDSKGILEQAYGQEEIIKQLPCDHFDSINMEGCLITLHSAELSWTPSTVAHSMLGVRRGVICANNSSSFGLGAYNYITTQDFNNRLFRGNGKIYFLYKANEQPLARELGFIGAYSTRDLLLRVPSRHIEESAYLKYLHVVKMHRVFK